MFCNIRKDNFRSLKYPSKLGIVLCIAIIFLSDLMGVDKTFASIFATISFFLFTAIPIIIDTKANRPRCTYFVLWTFALFIWWFFLVVTGDLDGNSIVRLFSLIVSVIAMPIVLYFTFKNRFLGYDAIKTAVFALVVLLLISNLVNPISFENVVNPFFERYEGIGGVNEHSIISAIALMLLLNTTFDKSIKLFFGVFLLTNIISTGSRSALLVVLIYILFIVSTRTRVLIVALAGIFSFILFSEIENILLLIRFDEYSTTGRSEPVFDAVDRIYQNSGMPFGLGVVNQWVGNKPLDNAYLALAVEQGFIGLILTFTPLLFALKKIYRRLSHNRDARFINVLFIAFLLLFHGFFENMLFSSLNIVTLIFWVVVVASFVASQENNCKT